MSCADFELLWNRANGACEICHAAPSETTRGILVIDHEPARGEWAVRGLLCERCNSHFERHRGSLADLQDSIDEYLSNPWYATVIAKSGVNPNPPEPEIGAKAEVSNSRLWLRTERGWFWLTVYGAIGGWPRSWRWMQHRYGPHNIKLRHAEPPASP
jgi:hypothetical protein